MRTYVLETHGQPFFFFLINLFFFSFPLVELQPVRFCGEYLAR